MAATVSTWPRRCFLGKRLFSIPSSQQTTPSFSKNLNLKIFGKKSRKIRGKGNRHGLGAAALPARALVGGELVEETRKGGQ